MSEFALSRQRRITVPRGPAAAAVLGLLLTAVVIAALLTSGQSPAASGGAAGPAVDKLPLPFVENRGQMDRRVAYYLPGEDTSAYFTDRGLTLSLRDRRNTTRRWTLALDFLGANATPVGSAATSTRVSYFGGQAGDWETGLQTYRRIAYPELWPGIDLIYSGAGGRLKYSFVVKPGADPSSIRMAWRGASSVGLDRLGRLAVSTPAGAVRDGAPRSYQEVDGKRTAVASSYSLDGRKVGFRLGSYDHTRPLVIDPVVVVSAGYIGGLGEDAANNIAVDAKGALYVTGRTQSGPDTFPDRVGPGRRAGGGPDVFVAKVQPSGRRLEYAGFLGGSGVEDGIGIDVDRAGSAYISGTTGSTEASFPVRAGPDLTFNGGPQDAFVAKIAPSGRNLVYAGYVGGSGTSPPGAPNEQANGIAVDRRGNAYVAGFTASSAEAGFPVTPGSFDPTFNGFVDTFVAKVSASGRRLAYAGYIGGSGVDPGTGLTIDRAGNAYVNGFTGSDESTFPDGDGFGPLPGPDRTYNGGRPVPIPSDAYVAKVNRSGTALVYAGYLGGAGVDQPFGNAVDRAGNVYLTGNTTSRQSTFPDGDGFGTVPGPDQSFNGGSDETGGDAFVVKVNRAGRRLLYVGYVGGPGEEKAVGISVDRAGGAYLSGETSSRRGLPLSGGLDRTYNGGERDAFVAKVHPSGRRLAWAGLIGGRGSETGIGSAVDSAGSVYLSGSTESHQGSFPARGGPDLTFNGPAGDADAFVAKVSNVTCMGERVTQVGTAGRDLMTGTNGGDVIAGVGGNDLIRGLGGDDIICGGGGRDRLEGGRGTDVCEGSAGRDSVSRCERSGIP